MRPTRFPEATKVLTGTGPVADLPVASTHTDLGPSITSCWRATWPERLLMLVGGRVWVQVLGGTHPPLAVHARPPWGS